MKANTGDPEEFLKHDVRFHQAIARAANNKLMSGVMDTVAQLLFHIRRQTITQASDLDEAIEWHEKIIAAMQKHDPKRAKEMLSGHLRAAQTAWAREHRQENNGKVEEGDKAGGKKAQGR
jgi:GntR family transcriptional repressor for pyruvate dehydrogenase complex